MRLRFKALAPAALLAGTSVAQAATVTTVECIVYYGLEKPCATGVSGLEFEGHLYDVTFHYGDATPFLELFPEPATYLFWGDSLRSLAAVTAIVNAFTASDVQGIVVDPIVTNGFVVPTSVDADGFLAHYGVFGGLELRWYVDGGWDQGPSRAAPSSVYAVFTAVREPGILLQQLLDVVTAVGPGKSLENRVSLAQTYYTAGDIPATCAVLADFVSAVSTFATGKKPKVSPELAIQLTTDAQTIMTAIGCN